MTIRRSRSSTLLLGVSAGSFVALLATPARESSVWRLAFGEAAEVVAEVAAEPPPESRPRPRARRRTEPAEPPWRRLSNAAPPLAGGCFDLRAEKHPARNALGGRFGGFARGGSTASVDLDPDPEGRRVLRLRCDRADGACGLWVHLFETAEPVERTYVDATEVAHLALWARLEGEGGVLLKVADARWLRRQGALALGELEGFATAGPLTGGWTRVLVPLDELPGRIARDSLAALHFEALDRGATTLELAGLELCARGATPSPLPAPAMEAPSALEKHRALWVWNTRELLAEPEARERFLRFVSSRGFDRVFLQLVPAQGQRRKAGLVPFDPAETGALVADLRAAGAEVYALDGRPSYVDPENHAGVLGTVQAVVEHNRLAPEEQRFHGVRYDIEPYVLPAYRGKRRDELLIGWIDLVSALSRAAREGGLTVGLDLPFWLDNAPDDAPEPPSVAWGGERRPVLEHLLRLVDDVAVMAYRRSAYGSGGAVVQALGEMDAAAALGVGVYVGVDTNVWAAEPAEGGASGVAGPSGGAASDAPFGSSALERMDTEVWRILRELGPHPVFRGLAYHHYGTLSSLLESFEPGEQGGSR